MRGQEHRVGSGVECEKADDGAVIVGGMAVGSRDTAAVSPLTPSNTFPASYLEIAVRGAARK